jgi:hypothetical protein
MKKESLQGWWGVGNILYVNVWIDQKRSLLPHSHPAQ